jgi:hypothetical protein
VGEFQWSSAEFWRVVLALAILLTVSLTVAVPLCTTLCCTRSWKWWLGAESNRRHKDFQSSALPTELPSQRMRKRQMEIVSESSKPAVIHHCVRHITLAVKSKASRFVLLFETDIFTATKLHLPDKLKAVVVYFTMDACNSSDKPIQITR